MKRTKPENKTVRNTIILAGNFMLVFLSMLMTGCNEFIEDDLSGKSVGIISPANGQSVSTNMVYFSWNELEGADWYNIQIVKPSFSAIQQFVIDTNVSALSFTFSLPTGNYEWRIRPENSAYQGNYVLRSFSVQPDSLLSQQFVNLLTPTANDTTNIAALAFKWDEVDYADQYIITVWKPDQNGQIVYTSTTTQTNYNYTINTDGSYEWGVKAINNASSTMFYTRKLVIDTDTPSAPILNSPINNANLSDTTVNFVWTHDAGETSLKDSLIISTDINFNNVVANAVSSIGHSTLNLSSNIYYWRVKSKDAAGNMSPYSNTNKMTVQ